jgi:iron complex outermembrane recepter protein
VRQATPMRLTALAAGILLAFSSAAQTSPAADAEQAPKSDSDKKAEKPAVNTLKEVVITAERRKESAQRTAIALTAVSGEDARDRGQTTLQSVVADTPALIIQSSPQGGQIYIRGIGSSGDSNWVDPAVGLMIDGVYSGRAEAVMSSLYDVARIEVLRGPQGTLYGRNSTGGTVNVISNEPSKTFGAAVNTQIGNYNLRHVDAMVNVPVNDTLQTRLAAVREKRDGYFSNNGYASDLTGARLKTKITPSEALGISLTLDHYQQKGDGATTVPRAGSNLPSTATWAKYPADVSDPWWVDDLHPADKQDIQFDTVSGQLDYRFDFGTLSVIPSYVKSRRYTVSDLVSGLSTSSSIQPTLWKETQKSLEVRLGAPAKAPTQWVLGAYVFRSDNNQVSINSSSGGSVLSYEVYGNQVPVSSEAVFGQFTQPLVGELRLIGGLRYTKDDKTQHYGLRSLTGTWDTGIQTVSTGGSAVTWKLGLEKDLAADKMVYLTASTGYKAGGLSTAANPPRTYVEEKLLSLELGSKNRFLSNTLQLNAAAYFYRYKNHQVQFPIFEPSPNPEDADGTTEFALWVTNAKTASNSGAELELKWLASRNDQLKLGLSYINAHYGDFAESSLSYLSGTRMANTAPWSGTLGYEHYFDLASGATVTATAQARLTQGYYVTPDKTQDNAFQGGYALADLSLAYHSADDRWTVGAWVRNAGNRAVTTWAYPLGRVIIGSPRTLGLNLNYSY